MFENEDAGPDATSAALTPKAERTRAAIRDAALRSFRDHGFDGTTMRKVAADAGVSIGNAYYYFPTKTHLVQELYVEVQEAHRAAALPRLDETTDLVERLAIVFRTGLEQLRPFHEYASGFLTAMIAPESPLNPMSAESSPARDITVGLFREAVARAKKNPLPEEFAVRMPQALWLGYLLLSLYWSYDRSPGQRRTERLLTQALKLLKLGLPLTRMPVVRGPLRGLLDLVVEVGE
ncbi:TetR family transcriptional regulator [Microbacterium mangrovi]|uniref:TetR family transcriptional regulator n=1 Tax=Microbacterium mangrovi TaxID=1348253 RepID=A0A0B2A0C9_9MICO|nr:TetR/AcrR family transcriptional regulator [Microbacterium mangrovi]KHK96461.1 TetR family transcriptional regulator [Microbacterium mangrovi]